MRVGITPTLEKSCPRDRVGPACLRTPGWFGCKVPPLPKGCPILPPSKPHPEVHKAGQCCPWGAVPQGPHPGHHALLCPSRNLY